LIKKNSNITVAYLLLYMGYLSVLVEMDQQADDIYMPYKGIVLVQLNQCYLFLPDHSTV